MVESHKTLLNLETSRQERRQSDGLFWLDSWLWRSLTAINGSYVVLILAGAIVVLFGMVAGMAFLISRSRSGSGELLWTGFVSFDEDNFGDTGRFPDLYRSRKRSAGRQGLTGGRLRIKKSGIYWKTGSVLTPGGKSMGRSSFPGRPSKVLMSATSRTSPMPLEVPSGYISQAVTDISMESFSVPGRD